MITSILSFIAGFILLVISKLGYPGVFFLMALQSFNVPLPSEITMTFSGFLAFSGRFNFVLIILTGALGNLTGAFLSYKLAQFIAGEAREKSKVLKFLVSEQNLDLAKKWFKERGNLSVFFGRMVPIISTFISLPAGLAKMNLRKFLVATFFGSLIWSGILAYLGFSFGENWPIVIGYFRKFDFVILAVLGLIFLWWLKRHFSKKTPDLS